MKATFKVEGMSCVNCARAIEINLKRTKGVKKVNVSFELGRLEVEFDESLISEEDIIRKVEELGYRISGEKKNYELLHLIFSLISSGIILTSMFLSFPFKYELQLLISTLVQFTLGIKFYNGAYRSLKEKVAGMDVLISLGTTGAYLYSVLSYLKLIGGTPFFETNVFLITFVRLGRFIEEKAREKAVKGLKEFFSISNKKVKVLENGKEVERNIREVFKGDKVVYRSGEQILTDGKVEEGSGEVDESVITGESVPVFKKKGDKVISGSVLRSGYLVVKVEKTFESSYINKIRNLIESSLKEKPQIQRISDKVSHYFVQFVVVFSILTFIFWYFYAGIQKAVEFSLAVLVVSCPCAFGIAVPLAVSVGVFLSLRKGIIPKKTSVFEKVPKVDTVVFDKTGTLTEGKLRVESYKIEDEKLLEIVYAMENYSNHPVAVAIREFLKDKVKGNVKLENCRELIGKGVECGNYIIGKPEIWGIEEKNGYYVVGFGTKEKLKGVFYLSDKLREEAKEVVDYLKKKEIEVYILSGDKRENVERVAKNLGIENVIAEVKPEEKLKVIENLQKEGKKPAMVGDGVNDAPALAKSFIGIAVNQGTDIAKISGDVIVNNIKSLINLFELSEKVYRKVKENLFWALIYNTVFIPVSAGALYKFGIYLKPEYAGLLMSLSSISVVLNTLRLLKD